MNVATKPLHIPLSFQPNHGQYDSEVSFFGKGIGYDIYMARDEIVFAFKQPIDGESKSNEKQIVQNFRLKFGGANTNAQITGGDTLSGNANYFIGNDPENWLIDIPTYAKVKYMGIYPNIDMVCYGNNGQIEYDFIVGPGTDPGIIALELEEVDNLELDKKGNIVLTVDSQQITIHKPKIYQKEDGRTKAVKGKFNIFGSSKVGFDVGEYDKEKTLIIDPVLSMEYSTYLGGTEVDYGNSIAVDSSGCIYVVGATSSADFPVKNAYQPTKTGYDDVFVTKLNAAGNTLVYSTYIGGTNFDRGVDIAVDSSGCVYITGITNSTDFPTLNAFQPVYGEGFFDAFATKLNSEGNALVYSTYLGGSGIDVGESIAVDSYGCVYLTGYTGSPDFPVKNAYQPAKTGYSDAFITKLNEAGNALVYSTYLGGTDFDRGLGIAVDTSGCVYVTGYTFSSDFPTHNAYQSVNEGNTDAFITKLNEAGNALVYSTYLGGSKDDRGYSIAINSEGSAYVTGYTSSIDFPVKNAYQSAKAGDTDVFITKLNAAGSSLVYSTYLGGTASDYGYDIAVDSKGSAYVVGCTYSSNFPVKNAYKSVLAGNADAFVTKFNDDGTALHYSTYLGGIALDYGYSIAIDSSGCSYVSGFTRSTDFPTKNAYQPEYAGRTDAFVTKLTQEAEYHRPTRGFDLRKYNNIAIHVF